VRQVGVELGEALRMASTYPAEFLKRSDLGRIAAGARADLVHIDGDLKATAVWRVGIQRGA
jgi:N-acetylglucosamine-6-phosphate deacetylase